MKILNRDQITEIQTIRLVFHSIEYQGKQYSRTMETKTVLPYTSENIEVHRPKIKWLERTNGNILNAIDKALTKELEALYQELPYHEYYERNGN